ncbi:hypothetical protein EGW08_000951 [Elysia chlorotica]|uniref:Uncharacterized protein n=1 Tax=Elysia chlorotica TaxID=188477 RepID=A0A3S1BXJ5_ELYCH|nr:hypothetical protein EGW08_000951 [Elysia chlorotica]
MPQPVRHRDRDYVFEDSDGTRIRRKEKIVETVGIPDDVKNVGKLVLYQSCPGLGYHGDSSATSSLERKQKPRSPYRASSPQRPVRESEKDYTYRDSEGTLRRHKERITERVGIPDDVVGLGQLVLSRESSSSVSHFQASQSRQVSALGISKSGVKSPTYLSSSPVRTPPPTLRKNFTYRESDGSLLPRLDPVTWDRTNRDTYNGVAAGRKPLSRDSSGEKHVSTMEIPRNKPNVATTTYRSPPTAVRKTFAHRESTESFARQHTNVTQRSGISYDVKPSSNLVPSSRESSEERHTSCLYHPLSPGKTRGVTKTPGPKVRGFNGHC